MNEADLELLKAEAFAATTRHNVALAQAISRIERDLAIMMEKVSRIEESVMIPPGGWGLDDEDELSNPPF